MVSKYDILNHILDLCCNEAPKSYKTYHESSTEEQLIKRRSLGFIHLYLKVKFGIVDFSSRHSQITEGSQDGGIDAYHIDSDNKKMYFIQSKYRANQRNFEQKRIEADELISMDISRVTKGEITDTKSIPYNAKILALQQKMRDIRDIAKYEYIVVILANVKHDDAQIRRLIENCDYQIFDYERAYNDLVFPMSTGTFYDPEEIRIRINLSDKSSPKLRQIVDCDFGRYSVTVLFVPCVEIAKILSKYKNSVLKFNPRCYLSLKKNSVNEKIRKAIIESRKNNFALLNNGITILADNLEISESTGELNAGQLILTQPQILNGGQTAYTLSVIYDEIQDNDYSVLADKEVMAKVITRIKSEESFDHRFVQMISNATNQQSEVIEADRRSNHIIQITLQKQIYEQYGYFYERKNGEFYEGLNKKIISKSLIIDRLDFIKAVYAYKGEPAAARRSNDKELFKEGKFTEILGGELSINEQFFAYLIFGILVEKELSFKAKTESIDRYGHAIIYGKWAVIYAISLRKLTVPDDLEEMKRLANEQIQQTLSVWPQFDEFVKQKNQGTKYFSDKISNFELFYKVNALDTDIKEFFLR
jgi:AIPR protein